MAKNNKKQTKNSSLKARFCRQNFPDLLQFLKEFDISSEYNDDEEEENYHDSLNMHCLLQAFDYKEEKQINREPNEKEDDYKERCRKIKEKHDKDIINLKQSCKWKINDVNEQDVLLAIDEYFKITSCDKSEESLRNILLSLVDINILSDITNILKNPETAKKKYTIVDQTTEAILRHFGITVNVSKLGKQRDDFRDFITNSTGKTKGKEDLLHYLKEVEKKRVEVQFVHAFTLLASLRNCNSHVYTEFLQSHDNAYAFNRYIIFTHIGIVYVCRRIWNKYSKELLSFDKYKEPEILELEKDVVKVNISTVKNSDSITNCYYSVDRKKYQVKDSGKDISFKIDVKKYHLFRIVFKCNGESYSVLGKLNYYSWEPILNIVVRPPKDVSFIFQGIAGSKEMDSRIGDVFAKYMNTYVNPKATKELIEENEKVINKLSAMEPQFLQLYNTLQQNNKENKANIKEIEDSINTEFEDIEKDLNDIKEALDGIRLGVGTIVKTLRKWGKDFKAFVIALIFILSCVILYLCCTNININLYFLKYKEFYYTLVLFVIGFTFWFIPDTWKLSVSHIKGGKLKFWITGVIALLLFGSPFLLKYPTMSSLAINYDFSNNNFTHNQEVVSLLENHLENNQRDDNVIVKLAKYYLNYAGEDDRAWEILQPMLKDPEVHKQHLVTIAETYFAKGSYKEVYEIVMKCKELHIPAVLRLEGLLFATPAVNMLDYRRGYTLLKDAASQGDAEAYYWLGHFHSNAVGSWNSSFQGGEKLFSLDAMDYDLLAAISYLRKAVAKNYPKAALELGNIYSDLIINDSAQVYYEIALANSDRNIKKEAYYRLGLLDEQRGDTASKNMQTAIDLNYGPALHHKAFKSGKSSILYIKKMEESGRGKNYGYIPSIVFRYFNKDLRDSALISLKRAHPDEIIDERFFDAIEAVYSDDSLANNKGRQMIRALSDHNKFSQMLTLYWDLKAQISTPIIEIQSVNEKIAALERIGKYLPFAYALAAYILKEMGPSYFEESDKFAQKAIISGHPAGAVVLAYIPASYYERIDVLINSFYKNGQVTNELQRPWNKDLVTQLINVRNKIHLGLRMSLPIWFYRSIFINYGQKIDYILYSTTKDGEPLDDPTVINIDYPEEHLRFWSNVAMGVNDFENEGWMSYQYYRHSNSNVGLYYREKLIEEMLQCVYIGNRLRALKKSEQDSEENRKMMNDVAAYLLLLKYCKWDTKLIEDNLICYLSEMPEAFKNAMMEKYGSDNVIKRVLENDQPVKHLYILGTDPLNGNDHVWFNNDKHLLEEWSAVYEGRQKFISIR